FLFTPTPPPSPPLLPYTTLFRSDTSAASLQLWLGEPSDEAPLHALLRDLHTLKGGARMAEIRPVGDLAHELEFLYEGLLAQRFRSEEHTSELQSREHLVCRLLLE